MFWTARPASIRWKLGVGAATIITAKFALTTQPPDVLSSASFFSISFSWTRMNLHSCRLFPVPEARAASSTFNFTSAGTFFESNWRTSSLVRIVLYVSILFSLGSMLESVPILKNSLDSNGSAIRETWRFGSANSQSGYCSGVKTQRVLQQSLDQTRSPRKRCSSYNRRSCTRGPSRSRISWSRETPSILHRFEEWLDKTD